MKNIFNYKFFLIIFIFFIFTIFYGALLRNYYIGGNKYPNLFKVAVFFAEIPSVTKKIIRSEFLNPNKPGTLVKHSKKNRITIFLDNKRTGLLILPRYDHSLSRSIIDILDLSDFSVLHSYKLNFSKFYNLVKNNKEFPKLKIDDSPIRFEYRHPLLLDDGSIIADSDYSPLFKIDFCSKLVWVNDEEAFHHSKMLDHEKNIWINGQLKPYSKYISANNNPNFSDDAIIKINPDGKILFKKSVIEILLENKLWGSYDLSMTKKRVDYYDFIHLNDIEPVFFDSKFWKKGDLFLSLRNQSSIMHYRPRTNKVINYLKGPFSMQHDVDIISEKEISIFNNNNFITDNSYSEILIYNFETKKFTKILENQLKKENFKTETQGLSKILSDGSVMLEESNHGRLLFYNSNGKKEWEIVNKDINGDIGFISWSRIIENELFIKKFKELVKNKKC